MHVCLFLKRPSVRHAIRRGTADNRVSLLLQPPGLFHQKILIDGCGLYHFHIPFFLFDDWMLRIVTIHYRHIQTFHIMQSRRRINRKGWFTHAALLGGERNEYGFLSLFHCYWFKWINWFIDSQMNSRLSLGPSVRLLILLSVCPISYIVI